MPVEFLLSPGSVADVSGLYGVDFCHNFLLKSFTNSWAAASTSNNFPRSWAAEKISGGSWTSSSPRSFLAFPFVNGLLRRWRGAHGREDGLDMGALLVLHFVDDEQMVGRFAARSSLGMVGEESHGGVAQDTARRPGRCLPMVAVEGIVEPFLQALHPAAQAIARGGEYHIASFSLQEIEQINEQVGHGFVLATLAAEEEEVFTAVLVADAIDDGIKRLELVVE